MLKFATKTLCVFRCFFKNHLNNCKKITPQLDLKTVISGWTWLKRGWWFHFFNVHQYLGKITILTNIFQSGWNYHLVKFYIIVFFSNVESNLLLLLLEPSSLARLDVMDWLMWWSCDMTFPPNWDLPFLDISWCLALHGAISQVTTSCFQSAYGMVYYLGYIGLGIDQLTLNQTCPDTASSKACSGGVTNVLQNLAWLIIDAATAPRYCQCWPSFSGSSSFHRASHHPTWWIPFLMDRESTFIWVNNSVFGHFGM